MDNRYPLFTESEILNALFERLDEDERTDEEIEDALEMDALLDDATLDWLYSL